VTYVVPIVAVFWDYVFFRNVPSAFEIVGVAAVLSGVVLLHAPSVTKLAPERVVQLTPE
jgi:drug/metabolite transporter (DMT)-like permease